MASSTPLPFLPLAAHQARSLLAPALPAPAISSRFSTIVSGSRPRISERSSSRAATSSTASPVSTVILAPATSALPSPTRAITSMAPMTCLAIGARGLATTWAGKRVPIRPTRLAHRPPRRSLLSVGITRIGRWEASRSRGTLSPIPEVPWILGLALPVRVTLGAVAARWSSAAVGSFSMISTAADTLLIGPVGIVAFAVGPSSALPAVCDRLDWLRVPRWSV